MKSDASYVTNISAATAFRSPRAYAWLFMLFAIPSVLFVNRLGETEYYLFHVLVFACAILALWALHNAAKRDHGNSVLLFFAIGFSIFHFGIIPVYLVDSSSVETIGFNLFDWYSNSHSMMPAYSMALYYLIGMVASVLLPIIGAKNTRSKIFLKKPEELARAASFVMVISIIFWCYIVSAAGFGGYDVLLEGLNNSGRGAMIGWVHTGIGLGFIVAASSANQPRKAVIIYGCWALFAFPLGLRGEVAFPALFAMALMAAQGRITLKAWRMLFFAVMFLAISSAVAVLRISTSNDTILGSLSIARGIAELGGSIRPAYEVAEWLAAGDPLQWGSTYSAPFERTFLGIFPVAERVPAELDKRLMNILIDERAGPYGFSIAAEAFYNFYYAGCFFVGILSGWVARYSGNLASLKVFSPITLALMFAIFIHIRQSFVTAYGAFMSGLIILTAMWTVGAGAIKWRR